MRTESSAINMRHAIERMMSSCLCCFLNMSILLSVEEYNISIPSKCIGDKKMRGSLRTVFMNLIPIAVSAVIALLLVSMFYTEHYSVAVSKLSEFKPADDRLECSVESVVYEGDSKDVLVIRGWAADTKLFSGYNYGAEMTVTSVYNETCFAVTDGTDVYRLKTIASVRADVNAMFPETVLPQGVERRFGIKSAAKMRNGVFDPIGMEVCVISMRKDEGPVIKRTGIMVP